MKQRFFLIINNVIVNWNFNFCITGLTLLTFFKKKIIKKWMKEFWNFIFKQKMTHSFSWMFFFRLNHTKNDTIIEAKQEQKQNKKINWKFIIVMNITGDMIIIYILFFISQTKQKIIFDWISIKLMAFFSIGSLFLLSDMTKTLNFINISKRKRKKFQFFISIWWRWQICFLFSTILICRNSNLNFKQTKKKVFIIILDI